MKILYDHQIFEMQSYGGISRYFYELIKNFKLNDSVEIILPIKKSNNIYLKDTNLFSNYNIGPIKNFNDFLPNINFWGKGRLYNNLFKLGIIKDYKKINLENTIEILKKGNFDILHPTYYDDYFLEYLMGKAFVLTIHDMTHEIYPEYFPLFSKEIKLKRELSYKASKIIAVSKSTKKDIIKIFGIDEKKIEVIYHGCSLRFSQTINENSYNYINKNYIPENYLLFIGNRFNYKNFYFFLIAIKKILEKNKDINLVCAGGENFTQDEIQFFNNLNLQDRLFYFDINNDNFLSFLYNKAVAFVFPSLYEGFGLPILEAFSCGCPVILSNCSSLPEIAEDAAIYFNPKDINSIIEVVTEVINNSRLRELLKEKGLEQLKKFSWEKTIQMTKKVYESII